MILDDSSVLRLSYILAPTAFDLAYKILGEPLQLTDTKLFVFPLPTSFPPFSMASLFFIVSFTASPLPYRTNRAGSLADVIFRKNLWTVLVRTASLF